MRETTARHWQEASVRGRKPFRVKNLRNVGVVAVRWRRDTGGWVKGTCVSLYYQGGCAGL